MRMPGRTMALRFAKYFGNSPEFWINRQNHYDIQEKKQQIRPELKKIRPLILPRQKSL